MKKFVALVLALVTVLTVMVSPALAVPPPEDIRATIPIPANLKAAGSSKRTEGTVKTPVQMVADELGIPVEEVKTFTDTDAIDVTKAYNLGIVRGVGGGEFQPLGTLTRAELLQMLYRAFGDNTYDTHEYQWSNNGQWVTEEGWWVPASHWYEDAAIYPFYEKVDEVSIAKLWRNYYGFDPGKYDMAELMDEQRKALNDSIKYDDIIILSYMLYAARNELDITLGSESLARNWAESREAGVGDNWRFITSRTNAYVTRAEGVSLFLRLFDM